jgi:hypothetical protein
MGAENTFETLDYCSILTWLAAREYFIVYDTNNVSGVSFTPEIFNTVNEQSDNIITYQHLHPETLMTCLYYCH